MQNQFAVSQVVTLVPMSLIVPGDNDRTQYQNIDTLAKSIETYGLKEPIIVRFWEGKYQIVAGHRRYFACLSLNMETIPCLIDSLNDRDADGVMLLENFHRQDLNPIDEANAYKKRIEKHGATIKELAIENHINEDRIRNRLSLLRLREDIQQLVATGNIPLIYAWAMTNLDSNFQMVAFRYLRETKKLNIEDFRRLCNDLLEKQNQNTLWNMDEFMTQPIENIIPPKPENKPETVEKMVVAYEGNFGNAKPSYINHETLFDTSQKEPSSPLRKVQNAIQIMCVVPGWQKSLGTSLIQAVQKRDYRIWVKAEKKLERLIERLEINESPLSENWLNKIVKGLEILLEVFNDIAAMDDEDDEHIEIIQSQSESPKPQKSREDFISVYEIVQGKVS